MNNCRDKQNTQTTKGEKPAPKKRGRKPQAKTKQNKHISNIQNDNDCIIAHIPIKINSTPTTHVTSTDNFLAKETPPCIHVQDKHSDDTNTEKDAVEGHEKHGTQDTTHDGENVLSDDVHKELEYNVTQTTTAMHDGSSPVCDNFNCVKHTHEQNTCDDESIHSDDSDMKNDIFITGNISTMTENEILQEKKINELQKTIEILNHKLVNTNTEKKRQLFKNTSNVTINSTHTKNPRSRCWHCVHEFEGDAIGLPEKFYNNTFYVFGMFCSFNCALKYNYNLNDTKIWTRTSLLHMMYNQYYEQQDDDMNNEITANKIQPAPPREQLTVFGGPMTIEQFRNSSHNNKSYRIILPPMVSIMPLVEEDYRTKCNIKVPSSNIPIDMNNLAKMNKSLKLKREKPLITSQYSLEKTMGIKRKPTIM